MPTLIPKLFSATKWLNEVFLRRNSLNPNSASKSLEIQDKQETVSKTNEELLVANKVAVESGTWVQQKFLW